MSAIQVYFQNAGDWKFTVRALRFFRGNGQPQRYAIALDDAPPESSRCRFP